MKFARRFESKNNLSSGYCTLIYDVISLDYSAMPVWQYNKLINPYCMLEGAARKSIWNPLLSPGCIYVDTIWGMVSR